MPSRSPFPMFSSGSDSRAALLQGLMNGALVVGTLYIAREVLLPLTLAILLSFVLTPLLLLLRKIKVPRVLAVIIVVTLAFAIIFGLGWIMSQQPISSSIRNPCRVDSCSPVDTSIPRGTARRRSR